MILEVQDASESPGGFKPQIAALLPPEFPLEWAWGLRVFKFDKHPSDAYSVGLMDPDLRTTGLERLRESNGRAPGWEGPRAVML